MVVFVGVVVEVVLSAARREAVKLLLDVVAVLAFALRN